MEEWKIVEIKDICTGIYEGPHATPKESQTGGVYLGIPAICADGHINFINAKRIAEEDLPLWTKRVTPQEDDIVFTNEATLNLYAIIPAGFHGCLGRRLGLIRLNKELVNVKYLFYYFFSPEWRETISRNKVSGATVERILMTKFPHFPVKLPPIHIQNKIATILSSIDDKIALNNRINHNLEQQAQIVFDRIFNSDLTNNCLLSSIVDINPKRTLRKNEVARCIDMTYLNTAGSFPSGWEFKPYSGGMKFINGDTLMARITPCLENGKVAYINFLDKEETAFGSTEYIVFHAKEGYPNEMFYFLTRNKAFIEFATKNMNGSSGRQRVSGETIGNYIIPVLSEDDINELKTVSESTMKEILKNNLESRVLSEMRNTILPKLMSGELKINDLTC